MELIVKANIIPLGFTGIVKHDNGVIEYRVHGKVHCEDGPAVIYPSGRKEYWVDDKLHRSDGPAIKCPDGYQEYYVDGIRHRIDGPAVIYPSGSKTYWIDGKQISQEEFDNRHNSCNNKTVEIDGKKYKLTLVAE